MFLKFFALILSVQLSSWLDVLHRELISLSLQVFTFGSVPLKTYLPDGDIDVTAFSNSEELKEIWANLVRDALEREEKSENAEFHVKEVQYIQAEVFFPMILEDYAFEDTSFYITCTRCHFLTPLPYLIFGIMTPLMIWHLDYFFHSFVFFHVSCIGQDY